jgi:hypothetical protein
MVSQSYARPRVTQEEAPCITREDADRLVATLDRVLGEDGLRVDHPVNPHITTPHVTQHVP